MRALTVRGASRRHSEQPYSEWALYLNERVPFYRPEIGQAEKDEVMAVLQSGWLTTGPRVKRFEREFAAAVRGTYAVALNSCTAALHLAVRALGLRAGDGVLCPCDDFRSHR